MAMVGSWTAPRNMIFDLRRDRARSVIVLGSARSGTTKLAELMSSAPSTRFIMEPLNPHRSPFASGWANGSFRDATSQDRALEALWSGVLNGSIRSPWTDSLNEARFVKRRVVKSIAGTNLAPWLRHRFPDTPIVYIVRNPLACAQSIRSLYDREIASGRSAGWSFQVGVVVDDLVLRSGLLEGPLSDRAEAIVEIWRNTEGIIQRNVLRWCMENYLALSTEPGRGLMLVNYEQLVRDPERIIADTARFTGLNLNRSLGTFGGASKTDWNHEQRPDKSGDARINGWRSQVSGQELNAAVEILQLFGLQDWAEPSAP
jgi:hypothetical protein